jgi:uncharacterized phage-like protein YoqJ
VILAVTGHRPDKLGGWKIPNPTFEEIYKRLDKKLMELRPTKVITGMALGVDQWVAAICAENDIPFIAAVPFPGQEQVWPPTSQDIYHQLLSRAEEIHVVSPPPYEPKKMMIRNAWMVTRCDALLAVWNGTQGGTARCIEVAQNRGKKVIFLDLPPSIPPQVVKKPFSIQMGGGIGNWGMTDPVKVPGMPMATIGPAHQNEVHQPVAAPKRLEDEHDAEDENPYKRFVDLS